MLYFPISWFINILILNYLPPSETVDTISYLITASTVITLIVIIPASILLMVLKAIKDTYFKK